MRNLCNVRHDLLDKLRSSFYVFDNRKRNFPWKFRDHVTPDPTHSDDLRVLRRDGDVLQDFAKDSTN